MLFDWMHMLPWWQTLLMLPFVIILAILAVVIKAVGAAAVALLVLCLAAGMIWRRATRRP